MFRVRAALLAVIVATPLTGQGRNKRPKNQPPAVAPAAAVPAAGDSLNNIKFRNLGPSVGGGRVAAVVGVPGDRNVYYVGAAAGGVWKTMDGGDSWDAVFKDQPTASIGAIALAPSNPNVVWVGTGEGNPRNDVVDGRGVFMSLDGRRVDLAAPQAGTPGGLARAHRPRGRSHQPDPRVRAGGDNAGHAVGFERSRRPLDQGLRLPRPVRSPVLLFAAPRVPGGRPEAL